MVWTINGIKYTVKYKDFIKYLIPVEENDKTILKIVSTSGNLSYLNRSHEVSEAIQEWEINHNTKLTPR